MGFCTHGVPGQQDWPGLPQVSRARLGTRDGKQRSPAVVLRHSTSSTAADQELLPAEAVVASQGQLASQSWPTRALGAPSTHAAHALLTSVASASSCSASAASRLGLLVACMPSQCRYARTVHVRYVPLELCLRPTRAKRSSWRSTALDVWWTWAWIQARGQRPARLSSCGICMLRSSPT